MRLGILSSLLFLFNAGTLVAHAPNISALVLARHESGKWVLQLNAPVGALQYAVESKYQAQSYATAEEFKKLAVECFRDEIDLKVNDESIELSSGYVLLGHSSSLGFEIDEMPSEMRKVQIALTAFSDIQKSQCFFRIKDENLHAKQVALKQENDYKVSLLIENSEVVLQQDKEEDKLGHSPVLYIALLGSGMLGLSIWFWKKKFLRTAK